MKKIPSDVVLESGSVLESDSSPYFEDADSDYITENSKYHRPTAKGGHCS